MEVRSHQARVFLAEHADVERWLAHNNARFPSRFSSCPRTLIVEKADNVKGVGVL